jgi:hypothetical protein
MYINVGIVARGGVAAVDVDVVVARSSGKERVPIGEKLLVWICAAGTQQEHIAGQSRMKRQMERHTGTRRDERIEPCETESYIGLRMHGCRGGASSAQ